MRREVRRVAPRGIEGTGHRGTYLCQVSLHSRTPGQPVLAQARAHDEAAGFRSLTSAGSRSLVAMRDSSFAWLGLRAESSFCALDTLDDDEADVVGRLI